MNAGWPRSITQGNVQFQLTAAEIDAAGWQNVQLDQDFVLNVSLMQPHAASAVVVRDGQLVGDGESFQSGWGVALLVSQWGDVPSVAALEGGTAAFHIEMEYHDPVAGIVGRLAPVSQHPGR